MRFYNIYLKTILQEMLDNYFGMNLKINYLEYSHISKGQWARTPDVSHYIDVIMTTMASQVTSLTVVYSTVYPDADQRKHQSSSSLAFVWGIHRSRWIPRTKGQWRGKCFHLMTSSCPVSVCCKYFGRNHCAIMRLGCTIILTDAK